MKTWPWPAVMAWTLGLVACEILLRLGSPDWVARGAGVLVCLAVASRLASRWRAGLVIAGLPLLWTTRALAADVAAAWWTAGFAALLLVYPPRAWRDAPYFPTARGALDPVASKIVLGAEARVLDAGCGLGRGLEALRRAWPAAGIHGVEWSVPLWLLARLRCPWARVTRGDLWAQSWQPFDVVYVFQRPESMARVQEKAAREMRPGTWLVSLEFAVPGRKPTGRATTPGGKPVWLYRQSGSSRAPDGR